MPEQDKDREILQILAEKLSDNVLSDLFPSIAPDAVRQSLSKMAGVTSSVEQPQQQTLFPESKVSSKDATCFLFTDGAARGNPGEAGAGAVLFDQEGNEIGSRSLYLGQCTNNVAEYRALLTGLDLAEQSGCNELHICLDSELIVRQIQGSYKVKNEQLKPLFAEVKNRLARLEKWKIRHVPRKENARADELANQGIDENVKEIGAGA